jgi:molybdenum cofactor cytidylyltransferase
MVENHQWAEGMGTSISTGMTALTAINQNLDAVVIVLCDQPFVSAPLLNQLVTIYQTTQSPIIASAYANTVGVPALFDRSLFPELMTMHGNVGAKDLIKQHAKQVFPVSFPNGAIDLDTPAQYQQLLRDMTTVKRFIR